MAGWRLSTGGTVRGEGLGWGRMEGPMPGTRGGGVGGTALLLLELGVEPGGPSTPSMGEAGWRLSTGGTVRGEGLGPEPVVVATELRCCCRDWGRGCGGQVLTLRLRLAGALPVLCFGA